ncbi:MAG: hypothetical protein GY786_17590, partial [Proteobacteria bacterium]|nr:hypothetical protein [Pseudomonadota bacterium]
MKGLQDIYKKLPSVQEIDNYLKNQGLESGREIRDILEKLLCELRKQKQWLS